MDATEDIRILVLLWKMGCNDKPSQLSKDEWMQGCATLGKIDSWDKFRKQVVPTLDIGFLDQTEFKDFYKFCFQFNRQGTHRTLVCTVQIYSLGSLSDQVYPAGNLSDSSSSVFSLCFYSSSCSFSC